MTSQKILPKDYTDAPEQHPNLILGSFQLLFWIFFHPTAWQNHVTNIDPTLDPDFSWSELSINQFHNKALLRLFFQGHLVLLFLLELVWVGFSLKIFSTEHVTLHTATMYIAINLVGSFGVSLLSGLLSSVAVGIAGGVAVCLSGFVAILMMGGMTVGQGSGSLAIAIGVAGGGISGSVAASIINNKIKYSLLRQIGGVILGVLLGILVGTSSGIVGAGNAFLKTPPLTVSWLVAFAFAQRVNNIYVVAIGLVILLTLGLRTYHWRRSFLLSFVVCIVFSIVINFSKGIDSNSITDISLFESIFFGGAIGIALSVILCTVYGFASVIANRLAGSWAAAIAGAVASGGFWFAFLASNNLHIWLLGSSGLVGGLTIFWWRPILFYPLTAVWNTILYRLDEQQPSRKKTLLRFHSGFWDEHQRLRLLGLDDHIVLVSKRHPVEAQSALDYLSTSWQRWAAEDAQTKLDARQLEESSDAETIAKIHQSLAVGKFDSPADNLLQSFNLISEDVDAALNQGSAYNQRLALKVVSDNLFRLLRELTRSNDKYAVQFRPIAQRWGNIIALELETLAQTAELNQEIDSPYIIGVPLTERQSIFVGRFKITARMEQLLCDQRRPPLLLYGQRRTGKTSLLNNLGRLLPNHIIPLFVDLQGPASSASDHAGFLYNLAKGMIKSAEVQRSLPLPPLPREVLADDPFTSFDEWLDKVETTLEENIALLALDEFEVLDQVLIAGRFNETAVLGMLRNLIQHRPRFKVLLSGSHSLEEFQRWSSYLINAQVIHLGNLEEPEARQLIEYPIEDFALKYEPEASQRVLDVTDGQPFLVQLLCAEIVALKNEQAPNIRRLATLMDVEEAIPEALNSGSMFFSDIQTNQIDAQTLEVIQFIARLGEGTMVSTSTITERFPETIEGAIKILLRRELIEKISDQDSYRIQIELIRRWFAS